MDKTGQEETVSDPRAAECEGVPPGKENDIEERGTKALEELLATFRREYQEQTLIFVELDRKAQATTALAGIFLAAVLSFVKVEELGRLITLLGSPGFFILIALVVSLIVVVGFSMWGTAIRNCPLPPDPEGLFGAVADVLEYATRQNKHFDNLIWQEIGLWKTTIEKYLQINDDKSRKVLYAQMVLSVAIIGVAILLVMILFGVYRNSLNPNEGGANGMYS